MNNSQIKSEADWTRQRNADAYSQISAPNIQLILQQSKSSEQGDNNNHQDGDIFRRHQYLNQQVLRKINQFIPPLHIGKSQEFKNSTINVSTFWISKVFNLIETLCYHRQQLQQIRIKQMSRHIRGLENARDECMLEAKNAKKQLELQRNRMLDAIRENQEKYKRQTKEKLQQQRAKMQIQKQKNAEAIKNQFSKAIKRLQIQAQTYKRKLDSKENQAKKQKSTGFVITTNQSLCVNQNFERLMPKNNAIEDLKRLVQKKIMKVQQTNQMFDNTIIQIATKIPKLRKILGISTCKSFTHSGKKQHKGRDNNIDLTNKRRMCEDLIFSMEQIVDSSQTPSEKTTFMNPEPKQYEKSENFIAESNNILLQRLIEMKNRQYARNINIQRELSKATQLLQFSRKQRQQKQVQSSQQFLKRIQKSQKQLRFQTEKFIEQFGL